MRHTSRTPDAVTPTTTGTLGRRSFIGGAAAAAVVAVACSGDDDADRDPAGRDDTEPDVTRTTLRPAGRLQWKGVNFDTDRQVWNPGFARREIEVIARDLHCNSLLVLGSDLDRLTEGAAIAADQGLHVWLEPRHVDGSADATIEFASAVARAAERLRADHEKVGLSLGVELTIFMDGLVPGDSWDERAAALGTAGPATYNAALNGFLADALTTIRPIFGGPLTYSSGVWEDVDWTGFDIVGIDLYRDAENEATFVDDVRALHRHGKPVVITEFGCCSFRGAEDMGGGGFTVIDWAGDPPTVREGLVRDEEVQARYIDELLGVFEAEKVDGAFVYDFIEPDNPHRPDPRHDLDMAGFGVVTCYPADHELAYDRTGHFEPKPAFHTIARHFA